MNRMNYCLSRLVLFYMKERKGQTFSGKGLVLDPRKLPVVDQQNETLRSLIMSLRRCINVPALNNFRNSLTLFHWFTIENAMLPLLARFIEYYPGSYVIFLFCRNFRP
ncbi:hypothetical protein M378DRAFT_520520 [Amanita muscaria Koide BX008]|uniref:Uncharacterized protein n=1 Tax=Amanita muscaria (strain Koide BX008) TaxID=946122 RepID=A0A0C2TFI3_AMAMK|nr:hypothetical protein M378DRAFT_520520 [Amanita muscaria Koide BX008]